MIVPLWNWDAQQFDNFAYPEALFQPLITWLLTTKRWIEEPDLVNRKVLALQRALAEYRQPAPSHHEADALRDPSELEEKAAAINKAADLKARRLANLAKARAVRKAKREAVHAA